ncbi:hypothetical protein [Lentzea roselyniae]|uniref:hypothetical protein n=1 Tax=Lentzea roselyniae TaxID=531940 RepID=UPI0031F729D7
MLRLLVLAAFMIGCVQAYDALPAPERSVMVVVAVFGGQLLWQGSGRKDRPVEQKPVDSAAAEEFAVECGVGRVRLWVRLIAPAVPLTGCRSRSSHSCSTRSGPTVGPWWS